MMTSFSLSDLDLNSIPGPDTIKRQETDQGITILVRENFSSPSVVTAGILTCGCLDETPDQRPGRFYCFSIDERNWNAHI